MNSLFERLRTRRLASAFVLLGTLSVAIVAGSFAAHGVRGQEKQTSSADATPLKVINSSGKRHDRRKPFHRKLPCTQPEDWKDAAQMSVNRLTKGFPTK